MNEKNGKDKIHVLDEKKGKEELRTKRSRMKRI